MPRPTLTRASRRQAERLAVKRGLRLPGASRPPRRTRTLTFIEFVSQIRPSYVWYKHSLILAHVLQRVADGQLDRLMVFMPPRHGKSEEISRLFSAYYLYRYPERFVGLCSYSASLAFKLSRSARSNHLSAGGLVASDANSAEHWETPYGGGLWAGGVGGSITGKGFHLGIIDDPVKNAQEAASETLRETAKDWYQSTFYTRAEPGAAIIVIQTRWHQEDLSGWLLTEETEDEEPERWHIVNLPAIRDEVDQAFPPSCTVELDWRGVGEALCPERYPLPKLLRMRARVGPYYWSALYQQEPHSRAGTLFKREWFGRILTAAPICEIYCRYWDNAATEGGGDYTVGVLMGRTRDGEYIVLDVVRGQWGPHDREKTKLATAYTDRSLYGHVITVTEEEGGSSGKDTAAATVRLLAGFPVEMKPSTGKKTVRAEPWASQLAAGNACLLDAPWNKAYIEEHVAFPTGKNDDQVDGSSGAFNRITVPFDFEESLIGGTLSAAAGGWN